MDTHTTLATDLFSPVRLGSLTLKNRITMAPLTRCRAGEGDVPGPLNATYYEQRAEAGLLISEATNISQQGKGYAWTPGIYTDAQVAGWRLVTDAVHAAGGLIFCQLLLGATMRHEHAGLSIDDFPLAYGQAWPKTDQASLDTYNRERLSRNEYATSPLYINIQMAHRVGAVLITVAILAAAAGMWLTPGTSPMLRGWSAAWVGLVFLQFLLGACTIWTNKAADIATAHVATGALTLVLGALLCAMSWRLQSQAELAKRSLA